MANKIQIKRSASNSEVTGLSNGELAYTSNGGGLYIGSPNGNGESIRIGGDYHPGTWTANQAVVVGPDGSVDHINANTANLNVIEAGQGVWNDGPDVYVGGLKLDTRSHIYAHNDLGYPFAGNPGDVLTVVLDEDGSIDGVDERRTVWKPLPVIEPSGSNTEIQFNDSGLFGGDPALTFNKETGTLTVTNISGNGSAITSVNAVSVGGNSATDLRSYSESVANSAYSNAMADTLSRDGTYTGNNTFEGTSTFNGYITSDLVPDPDDTHSLGTSDAIWTGIYVQNVHSHSGHFGGNLDVSGDLNVSGNITTVNVSSIVVTDPMIHLASNNTSGDILDIGFVGTYNDGETQRFTGVYRDSNYGIYKFFSNTTQDLTGSNNVDPDAEGYVIGTLETYLISGGLVSNTSGINITANSSYSVALIANSLSLSQPLSVASGGTGKDSITENALIVGDDAGNFVELALGSEGYVLQSNGSALVYDILDGGTF